MITAFITGVAVFVVILAVSLISGNLGSLVGYAQIAGIVLITLAALMSYNTLRVPNPYYQEDTAEDHRSRWRWTFYFLLAALPQAIFLICYYLFAD